MIGFIPIAIAAVAAAASIAQGMAAGSASKKQAAVVAESVEKQMEEEKKLFALQQDTRLWQMNEAQWQRTREKAGMMMARRADLQSLRLEQRLGRIQKLQETMGNQEGAFQADQQALLGEQGLEAEREAVGQARQQATGQAGQAIAELPGGANLLESTQQMMSEARLGLARDAMLSQAINQDAQMVSALAQNQEHARTLIQAQQNMQAGAYGTNQRLTELNRATETEVLPLKREGVRLTHRMALKAARANMFAERALYRNQSQADLAEHEMRLAQLQGMMPVSQNNTMGIISQALGAIGPIAGQVLASRSPSVAPQPAQQMVGQPLMQPAPTTYGVTGTPAPQNAPAPMPYPNRLYSGFPTTYSGAS